MENKELKARLEELINKIDAKKGSLSNEQVTKTVCIAPFFEALGYDVRDPDEFFPEYTADIGQKKGEKVDYAILSNDDPQILIEAKPFNEDLDNYTSQLYRYFGTKNAKVGILTNGAEYRFYTDLDTINKMDKEPFMRINIMQGLKDTHIKELLKFTKGSFDTKSVREDAKKLRYTTATRALLAGLLQTQGVEGLDEDFRDFVIKSVHSGKNTERIKEELAPIIVRCINEVFNDEVNRRLEVALAANRGEEVEIEEEDDGIITTEEEIEGYGIIKQQVSDLVPTSRIFYRDTRSYFNILLDDNNRRWIARLYLDGKKKELRLRERGGTEASLRLEDGMNSLSNYKQEVRASLQYVLDNKC